MSFHLIVKKKWFEGFLTCIYLRLFHMGKHSSGFAQVDDQRPFVSFLMFAHLLPKLWENDLCAGTVRKKVPALGLAPHV